MSKLVIMSQDRTQLTQIKNDIEPLTENYKDLKILTYLPSLIDDVLNQTVKVLVFDTRLISRMIFPQIVRMRKKGFSGPVVLLGDKSSEFDTREMAFNKNIYLLEKPYTAEQLRGLLKNSINIEEMRQRRDQRFDVQEVATLQAYSSDYQTQTTICNISRSGVRIEGDVNGLHQGDLLRLHFNFEKIQKERTMSARVVWKKENNGKFGEAGLEFVSQKVIYQYLLDYDVA